MKYLTFGVARIILKKKTLKTYESLLAKLLGTCGSIICASGASMIILEHLSEDSEDGE